MPIVYFDTSALVKHYQVEDGSSVVNAILDDGGNRIVVGRLGITETISALAQRVRAGALSASSFSGVVKRVRADAAARKFTVLRVLQPHFAIAERLIAHYGLFQHLRTLDALLVAIALAVQQKESLDAFVSADDRLNRIAASEGLVVQDPTKAARTT